MFLVIWNAGWLGGREAFCYMMEVGGLQEDYLDGGSGKPPNIPDNDSTSLGLRIMK